MHNSAPGVEPRRAVALTPCGRGQGVDGGPYGPLPGNLRVSCQITLCPPFAGVVAPHGPLARLACDAGN